MNARVPGAEPKTETVEIGAGGDADAWLRMPDLFAMHASNGKLVETHAGFKGELEQELKATVAQLLESRAG